MLSAREFIRYERHIELDEIGELGQEHLMNSKVLIVGAGGLGCPAALYLNAAGIGHITIIDDDKVNLSNLQRQILFPENSLGLSKVSVTKEQLSNLNKTNSISEIYDKINIRNVDALIRDHDIIIDGSDNFETRYLLNTACYKHKKPLVSGSVLQFDGQISVFKGYNTTLPCYNCLYPYKPQSHEVPSCRESAVIGPLPGIIGSMMAVETIKELLEIGSSLSGYLLLYNSFYSQFRKMSIKKRTDCDICANAREKHNESIAA